MTQVPPPGRSTVVTVEQTGSTQDDLRALAADAAGWPHLSGLRTLAVTGTTVTGERETEDGWWELAAELPAVASTSALPDPPRRRTMGGRRRGFPFRRGA